MELFAIMFINLLLAQWTNVLFPEPLLDAFSMENVILVARKWCNQFRAIFTVEVVKTYWALIVVFENRWVILCLDQAFDQVFSSFQLILSFSIARVCLVKSHWNKESQQANGKYGIGSWEASKQEGQLICGKAEGMIVMLLTGG